MTDRAKWGLAAGLATVWVGLLAMQVFTREEPERVPLKYKSGRALSKAAAAPVGGVPVATGPAKPRDGDTRFQPPKNIFAPLERRTMADDRRAGARRRVSASAQTGVVPVAAPPPPPPVPPLSPEEVAAQQARRQQEMAAQRARQAMAQYRFIGYLTQNGEPRAFLGKGQELYVVRAGETLEGQIHVATIDASLLKLRDGASDTERALPLTVEDGRPGGF